MNYIEALKQFEEFQKSGWDKNKIPSGPCLATALKAVRKKAEQVTSTPGSRHDFIENLQMVNIHLLILTQDIRYPLSDQHQECLDYAAILIAHLIKEMMQEDLEEILGQSEVRQ